MITLFVNGTLMQGLALHSVGDRHPGMYEVEAGGVAVEGELYEMDDAVWQRPGTTRTSLPAAAGAPTWPQAARRTTN